MPVEGGVAIILPGDPDFAADAEFPAGPRRKGQFVRHRVTRSTSDAAAATPGWKLELQRVQASKL